MAKTANSPKEKKRPKQKKQKQRSGSETETADRVVTGRVEKKLRFPFKATLSSFDRPIVDVIVGAGRTTFRVHENVLTASSFFLQDLINSRSEGSRTEQIVLSELPHTFNIYINWLYSGRLYISMDDRQYGRPLERSLWALCYKLAWNLKDCAFMDALIDMIIEKMVVEDYKYVVEDTIYKYAEPGSPHRKLAVDLAVNTWNDELLESIGDPDSLWPQDFVVELLSAFAVKARSAPIVKVSTREFLKDIDTCIYHEHTITKIPNSIIPCYKTK